MYSTITQTNISDLTLLGRGKVRDIYDLHDKLLIIATDRISCFDVVLPTPIPEKGEILNQISLFWFDMMKKITPNHLSNIRLEEIIKDKELCASLEKRTMIVNKASPLPIEAIVRGYISGSAWEEYKKHKTICGQTVASNLAESDKLPEPMFTPSTKAELGMHDESISFAKMCDIIGGELANKVKEVSINIYNEAASFALKRGIIIADTKFEFGILDGKLILIDELLTPDSSRFWPASEYKHGKSQSSFDKQFVRDYLINTGWNKEPPAPLLPDEIVRETQKKYKEALEKLVC